MIRASLKRILYFMPFVIVYFLVLGLTALAFSLLAESVLFKDGSFSAVKVAYYLPDDSALNETGFSFVSHMESVEGSISFVEYDSDREVREAVDEEDVSAGLIIPADFASGIFSGTNPEIEVVFKSADTFDEHVVADIMLVLANDLGVGQASVQATYSLCDEYGIDPNRSYAISEQVRVNELAYAMDRFHAIDIKTIDDISTYTLVQKVTASVLIYIFILSVFVFAYFCKGSNRAFVIKAKLSGISLLKLFATEALSVWIMMYIVFVLFFIGLKFTSIGIKTSAVLFMIPVMLLLSCLVTGICYLFKTPVSASYISFAFFTVLMYGAGGLLPIEFLPRFLQKWVFINPLKYLIDFTLEVMFG